MHFSVASVMLRLRLLCLLRPLRYPPLAIRKTRPETATMATLATDRRVHPRHLDGRFDRPRSTAVRLPGLLVSVAPDPWQQIGVGASSSTGHCRADRVVEAVGSERNRLAGQAKAADGFAGKHHRHSGLRHHAAVATVTE